MPEQIVEKSLEKKYQKKFILRSSNFSAETGNYHITASPEDNEDLVFQVEHNPKKDHVNDFYPYALWQSQGTEYVKELLTEVEIPYVMSVGVKCRSEFDVLNIPEFKDLVESNPADLKLNLFIHVFAEPKEENIEWLTELDGKLRGLGLKLVGFTTSFYNPESIEDENLDELDFGFNALSDESFETTHTEDFLGLIKYRIDDESEDSPSSEKLLSIMVDTPDHFMFEYL